ncbi:MAG: NTP transferase domain-containing protein [Acidimicrobiales bacterium]
MGGLTTQAGDGSERPVVVVMAAGVARRYGGCKPLAPVGLHGEAVLDINVGDARRAGFGSVVLVLGPATGPAISYHVARTWPDWVPVASTVQSVPLGTVHAVLRARALVGDRPFAVVNADDIYGVGALRLLADHLGSTTDHALVSYELQGTVVTADPVTRGMCETEEGWLRALVERRSVVRRPDGTFSADDGLEPKDPPPDTPVSMNLWGFQPRIWPYLVEALHHVHPTLADDGSAPGDPTTSATEVLLPEVVGAMVRRTGGSAEEAAARRVRVLPTPGRCIGVTHADDVPVVRTELAEMVGRGRRPESVWETGP